MTDLEKELTLLIARAPIMPYHRTVDYFIDNGVTIQKWVPMTERLPDIDVKVLVYDAETDIMHTGTFDGTLWHLGDGGWLLDLDDFTHWMPLPKPPKEN